MPGPNLTGTPETRDYNLGRGIVYFASLDANGLPLAWRDLGNSPDFKINNASEVLDHKSSRAALRQIDKSITLSRDVSLSFSLDEFNDENLAALFSATQAQHTNAAVAGFTQRLMLQDGALALGRWYDITNTQYAPTAPTVLGARAYDIDKTKLTVKTNEGTLTGGIGGSPITLVEGTDYTVDEEMGRIFILSTSTAAQTAITAARGLLVTLTADAFAAGGGSATTKVYEIKGLQAGDIKGAIKFVAANPADDGKRREYQFHQLTLKADGDLSLIGDDWSLMNYTAKAEENDGADADSPTVTIRIIA